jgi:hypothetical protein
MERECAICLVEIMRNPAAVTCGHVFCYDCIRTWCARYECTCPVCREPVYRFHGHDVADEVKAINPFAPLGVGIAGGRAAEVFVESLAADGQGARCGVKVGDSIALVNDEVVRSPRQVEFALRHCAEQRRLCVLCMRPARTERHNLQGVVVRLSTMQVLYSPRGAPLRAQQIVACDDVLTLAPGHQGGGGANLLACFGLGVFTARGWVNVVVRGAAAVDHQKKRPLK